MILSMCHHTAICIKFTYFGPVFFFFSDFLCIHLFVCLFVFLVTGASFIVFSGALKTSSPFMAKVNIVEGLFNFMF